MKKPIVLRIYKGDQLQGVKQSLDSQIVIGLPGDTQIPLEGQGVSLLHASIEEREDGYFISDLGSETGTFVNGEKVLDGALNSGDVLQIGEFKIEFFIGPPKPKAAGEKTVVGASIPLPPPTPTPATVVTAPPEPPAPPAPTVVAAPVVPVVTPEPPTPPVVATPTPPPVEATPPLIKTPPVLTPPPVVSAPPVAQAVPTPPPVAEEKLNQSVSPPSTPARPAVNRIETGSTPAISAGGGVATNTASIASTNVGAIPKVSFGSGSPKKATGSDTSGGKGHKPKNTFAPPSKYKDTRDFVKPSKGTVVEVLVAWGERVISTHHFYQPGTISIGAHPSNDIVVPVLNSKVRKLPILKIDRQAIVLLSGEMRGELVQGQTSTSFAELARSNRIVNSGGGMALALDQGELAKIQLGEQISVLIRYVSESPKPLVAPLFDLTSTESVGILLSAALVVALWIFIELHNPASLGGEEAAEPLRTATIMLTPPTPVPLPPSPPQEPEEKPQPTPPPQIVKATPAPTKQEVKLEQKKAPSKPESTTKAVAQVPGAPGKSANAAPNKNKTGPKIPTSAKQGGAIKSTDSKASQMQSKSRDVSKAGIFSAFGGGGAQDKLAGSTTGSGELVGMAGAATGKAGFNENRQGQGLGSSLKDTGRGGTGKALEGIAGGIGTEGRGSGNSGYGTGGLGNREGVKIVTGGTEESFSGTIDREAIRRVILANYRVIKTCYERQLNRNPDLFGKLVLKWEIGEQGRVVSAGVKSNELGNKDVAECILNRLRTWKFPEPPSNQVVEVAYPFFFSN